MEPRSVAITPLAQVIPKRGWHFSNIRRAERHHVFWLSKGQGNVRLGTELRPWGPNTLVFVPAGAFFAVPLNRAAYGTLISIEPGDDLTLPDAPFATRLGDIGQQALFIAAMENMSREGSLALPLAAEALRHHAALLGILICRTAPPTTDERPTKSRRLVAAFLAALEDSFHTSPSVATLAKGLGVTPTHLTRCCQQILGKSAIDVISDRVIYAARRRLTEGSLPVKRVGESLGFRSPAYFTRAFSARTGQSPTAYREQFSGSGHAISPH